MAPQTLALVNEATVLGNFPALDKAVSSLVSASFIQGRYRIDMPVLMPSGSAATVTVWPEGGGETFLVTDDGSAHFEVVSGAFNEKIFLRVAKDRCERYGAGLDGASMLFVRVSAERLRGAIVSMANLMKEVVDETVQLSIAQKARPIDQELWDKLERAFLGHSVERKAHFLGESTAMHVFSAAVRTEKGLVLFDTFSAQGNSINSVYVKMADMRRNEDPPRGIAVTTRMSEIGPKLNLLNSVAQVVEIGIGVDDLHRLAVAA
jgi:hypothetical protein